VLKAHIYFFKEKLEYGRFSASMQLHSHQGPTTEAIGKHLFFNASLPGTELPLSKR
jgi:hypothetical protein